MGVEILAQGTIRRIRGAGVRWLEEERRGLDIEEDGFHLVINHRCAYDGRVNIVFSMALRYGREGA